jgi:hypothetical protein
VVGGIGALPPKMPPVGLAPPAAPPATGAPPPPPKPVGIPAAVGMAPPAGVMGTASTNVLALLVHRYTYWHGPACRCDGDCPSLLLVQTYSLYWYTGTHTDSSGTPAGTRLGTCSCQADGPSILLLALKALAFPSRRGQLLTPTRPPAAGSPSMPHTLVA